MGGIAWNDKIDYIMTLLHASFKKDIPQMNCNRINKVKKELPKPVTE